MGINRERSRQCLNAFDFRKLFIEELGWDRFTRHLETQVDGRDYRFKAVAQKRGVVVLVSDSIPEYAIRVKADKLVAKEHFEHLIVFTDQAHGRQVWQWVRKEPGKPTAVRTYHYKSGQSGELLLQKLDNLAFTLEEEEILTLGDVTGRLRRLDVEKVTKRFYDRFKTEHSSFLGFIKGIPDEQIEGWYASVMINRLMFLYFIQEKGFLNEDKDYLRNKLAESRDRKRDAYYSDFLSPLFFQGFARKTAERSAATNRLLGKIPYLNGGLFQKHQIEELHGKTIVIPDKAFEKLFDFFKEYNWHLDERENRNDREINPDVLGYIFEKYINQKQMGAYYTKEDITEYIAQNTIIPFLLDEARKGCAVAFAPEGSVWRLLRDDPDRYIHDVMKRGADLPLPADIEVGVSDASKRAGWNRAAPEEFAFPTEIWRETIDRHERYRAVKAKLADGEVHQVNDLVTLNLNIRQFAQDVIQFSEGPELLRAIWKAIEDVSVLDPTCGSGAFLFAALNILKPLYEACLQRMAGFVEDMESAGSHHPAKYSDFKQVLDDSRRHPKQDYFILKAIIVNNLFGVDIMEEAVEICKLRLFLKLVAQVESQDLIEPLPDIDFNIRSGNTLVGYARYADVERAIRSKLDFSDAMTRIEDKAKLLDSAVKVFRKEQTQLDGTVTPEDKAELRRRLAELDNELNDYLSGDYGVKKAQIQNWKDSHKPFHWFVQFHSIMDHGGFDVIIGNPPYVELSKIRSTYQVRNYKTEKCGNLFPLVQERSVMLAGSSCRSGFIIPMAGLASRRMQELRDLLIESSGFVCVSSYAGDTHPSVLFEGVRLRLSIVICDHSRPNQTSLLYTTIFQRWYASERRQLFSRIAMCAASPMSLWQIFPRLGGTYAKPIWNSLHGLAATQRLTLHLGSGDKVFYQEAAQYFVKACHRLPYFKKNGVIVPPPHGRFIRCSAKEAPILVALLSSSLFYLWYHAVSDCYHLSDAVVQAFPCPHSVLSDSRLRDLGEQLERDLHEKAKIVDMSTVTGDKISYAAFNYQASKTIIDKIDRILGSHYDFSDNQIDFVVNYDGKYRMGSDATED
jgi:Eco57I restriction-modification methylase